MRNNAAMHHVIQDSNYATVYICWFFWTDDLTKLEFMQGGSTNLCHSFQKNVYEFSLPPICSMKQGCIDSHRSQQTPKIWEYVVKKY